MDAQKNRDKLLTYVGLSILVHILLLIAVRQAQFNTTIRVPNDTVYVDLDNFPKPAFPQEREKAQPKQVAESEVAPSPDKPKDAKYLGERDQSVEQETRSRQVDIFRKGGAASKSGSGGKPTMALKDLAPTTPKAFTPPTKAEIDGFKEQQKQVRRESNTGGSQSADASGSATNDYLKDVKEGDRTLLSTKEFVYFSYYRRIREKLEVAWNSRLRSALGDYVYGGRQLATDRNYVTALVIVLDRYGKITAIQVMQQSGARDLDQAAVDAFNQAGPFPDPPSGLVDKDGLIKIRWDFILQS